MAPLTNAERQKRYRERLKARADGLDLAERARAAIVDAAGACWEIAVREGYSDWDGIATTPDEALAWMRDPATVKREGLPSKQLREWFAGWVEDADEGQRETLQRAIDLIDAVNLR